MKKNRYFRKLLLCAICLCALLTAHGQNIVFQEDWSGFNAGQSPVGQGYTLRRVNPPADHASRKDKLAVTRTPEGNSYLSITSHGYPNVNRKHIGYAPNLRSSGKDIIAQMPQGQTLSVWGDMRFLSPGTPPMDGPGGYPGITVITDSGAFWFGFTTEERVFISMRATGADNPVLYHTVRGGIQQDAWYRFRLDLSADGKVDFFVYQLEPGGGVKELWHTSNTEAGYAPITVKKITAYQFTKGRSGSVQSKVSTSDFSGITFATGIANKP